MNSTRELNYEAILKIELYSLVATGRKASLHGITYDIRNQQISDTVYDSVGTVIDAGSDLTCPIHDQDRIQWLVVNISQVV